MSTDFSIPSTQNKRWAETKLSLGESATSFPLAHFPHFLPIAPQIEHGLPTALLAFATNIEGDSLLSGPHFQMPERMDLIGSEAHPWCSLLCRAMESPRLNHGWQSATFVDKVWAGNFPEKE